MPDFLTTIKYSGAIGLLALLTGTLLMILAAGLIAKSKRRGHFAVMLVLATLPVGIGLVGTYLGFQAMDAVIAASKTPVTPAEYEAGAQQAWCSTQVGLYACGPAFLLAWVGLLLNWRRYTEDVVSCASLGVSTT